MKIVINRCFGGFSISDKAYEKLIEYGIPVRKYIEPKRNKDGTYEEDPYNDGRIIFDNELIPKGENEWNDKMYYAFKKSGSKLITRYWSDWIYNKDIRTDPLLIKVVEELKDKASGMCADLKIIEIPDDIDFEISEYDGMESVEEIHRSWN